VTRVSNPLVRRSSLETIPASPGAQVQKPPGRSARAAKRTCALFPLAMWMELCSCSGESNPVCIPRRRAAWGGWGRPAPPAVLT
jgi:hypothetical protein